MNYQAFHGLTGFRFPSTHRKIVLLSKADAILFVWLIDLFYSTPCKKLKKSHKWKHKAVWIKGQSWITISQLLILSGLEVRHQTQHFRITLKIAKEYKYCYVTNVYISGH
jgi:hypothetical protein